ncbi:MAG: hypothetical protein ACKN9T_17760 [Candidatus Methylumidiphilus sp.]
MRSLAFFAMAGRPQAIFAICGLGLASLLLPPLGLFSTALVALVALRKGAGETAWTLALALALTGLAGVLLSHNAGAAVAYGLLLWLPVWPLAAVLRASRRLDLALASAVGLGVAAVLLAYGLVDDSAALWREHLQVFVQPMLENAPADFDAAATAKVLDALSHYATGMAVAGSVMSALLALLIARWQQAALYNPGGFRSEFVALRLSAGLVFAALGGMALGSLAGGALAEIAWNASTVFFVPFIIGGFAVLHALLGGKSFWIVGVYLALFIMPQLLLPAIALLGASDPWLDWRKLAKRTGDGLHP